MADIPYKHIDVGAYLSHARRLYEVVRVGKTLISLQDCSSFAIRKESRAYIAANFSLEREPIKAPEVIPS